MHWLRHCLLRHALACWDPASKRMVRLAPRQTWLCCNVMGSKCQLSVVMHTEQTLHGRGACFAFVAALHQSVQLYIVNSVSQSWSPYHCQAAVPKSTWQAPIWLSCMRPHDPSPRQKPLVKLSKLMFLLYSFCIGHGAVTPMGVRTVRFLVSYCALVPKMIHLLLLV